MRDWPLCEAADQAAEVGMTYVLRGAMATRSVFLADRSRVCCKFLARIDTASYDEHRHTVNIWSYKLNSVACITSKILASCGLIVAFWTCGNSAQAAELIVNGGFETGTLSGWTTSGLTVAGGCGAGLNATDWTVSNTGTATNCSNPGAPPVGSFAAYNMFDAGAPTTYRLRQAVVLPNAITAATLAWRDSITDNHSGAPRVFSVNVLNASGTVVLATLYTFNSTNTNTGWVSRSVNATAALAPLSGQSVILEFSAAIPAAWTGGAGMGLDAVSFDVTGSAAAPASIPTLSEWALIGLSSLVALFGIARMRRRQV